MYICIQHCVGAARALCDHYTGPTLPPYTARQMCEKRDPICCKRDLSCVKRDAVMPASAASVP